MKELESLRNTLKQHEKRIRQLEREVGKLKRGQNNIADQEAKRIFSQISKSGEEAVSSNFETAEKV